MSVDRIPSPLAGGLSDAPMPSMTSLCHQPPDPATTTKIYPAPSRCDALPHPRRAQADETPSPLLHLQHDGDRRIACTPSAAMDDVRVQLAPGLLHLSQAASRLRTSRKGSGTRLHPLLLAAWAGSAAVMDGVAMVTARMRSGRGWSDGTGAFAFFLTAPVFALTLSGCTVRPHHQKAGPTYRKVIKRAKPDN